MKISINRYVLFAMCLCQQGFAQPIASTFWLRIGSPREVAQSMYFGNTDVNTFGIDSLAQTPWREFEPPNFTSVTFDCVWGLPPAHGGEWGAWRGLYPNDFRALLSQSEQDTFVLKFSIFEVLGDTLTFRWPDAAHILDRCDSLVLIDRREELGFPGNRLNMAETDTLMIPNPAALTVVDLWIVRYGIRAPVEARPETAPPGAGFELFQCYPNPFNPSTTILIEMPHRGFVTLEIYSLLGEKVATLNDGMLDPGRRSFQWDATGYPSGVYVARMLGDHVSIRRMVLTR